MEKDVEEEFIENTKSRGASNFILGVYFVVMGLFLSYAGIYQFYKERI